MPRADLAMAQQIAYNAKVQRPGVCNAAETLLVHADIAPAVLPGLLDELREAGVELRVDARTRALAGAATATRSVDATEEDWDTEYLGLTMAVKMVDSLEEAIDHVNRHGTGHSEAIVTADERAARGVHRAGGRGLRVRERLHALHRRRRVRHGRGDGQLDPEAPRARPDRAAGADHLQVRRPRHRPGARVATAADGTLRLGILGGVFNPPHIGHLVLRPGGLLAARSWTASC